LTPETFAFFSFALDFVIFFAGERVFLGFTIAFAIAHLHHFSSSGGW
jgi:hypothetical protein